MPTIFFASNRDVRHETSGSGAIFGNRFNADGPQCFRVGECEVAFSGGDPGSDDSWAVGRTRLYPETLDSRKDGAARVGSATLFEKLRAFLKSNDSDVVIFLHGFANSFQNAAQRAAALETIYSTSEQPVMVILFSWPSNGQVQPFWNYFSDREDAEASGLAMGRALMKLVDFLTRLREEDQKLVLEARQRGEVPDKARLRQCTRRLHVVAHSMGNWALRHALLKFAQLNGDRIARVLDCAFLMAADEDNDAFEHPLKLRRLDELANRVFVYHAANDVALTISDRTKGMPDRLGSDGPQNLDVVGERVLAIDCQKVSETEPGHGRHQYYRLRKEVIADVQLTLRNEPQDGRAGREVVRPGRSWRLRT